MQWDINSWTEIRRKGSRFPGLRSGRGAGGPPGPWQIGSIRSGGRRIPCVARYEKSTGEVWRLVSYRRPQLILGEIVVTGLSLAAAGGRAGPRPERATRRAEAHGPTPPWASASCSERRELLDC